MSILVSFRFGHRVVAFSPPFQDPEAAPWWRNGGAVMVPNEHPAL